MKQKNIYLIVALSVLLAVAALVRVWTAFVPEEPPVISSDPLAQDLLSSDGVGSESSSLAQSDEDEIDAAIGLPAAGEKPIGVDKQYQTERHTSVQPLPELPPTLDLTGAKLGNQRIEGVSEIGDVYRLQWHEPTQTLFMAVVERDGMRSIWRLDPRGEAHRVMELNRLAGDFNITGDSRGRLYAQFENPGRLYRSADGGVTWRPVLNDVDMFWNIADDGQGTLYGSVHSLNQAILYRSEDDGLTWKRWVDFHKVFPEYAVTYAEGDSRFKLRHLHGVAWIDGKIFVGVGDEVRFTIMSADGGKTWKKVWDEGFTASVLSPFGTKLILGPDTISRFGLAVYDTVDDTLEEVWNPIPYNYAGYTYSIVEQNGVYYAGFHTEANEADEVVPKFGVIVSPDADRWYPFLEFGPLTSHATTTVYLAPAGDKVFISINGSLYAFRGLEREWFQTHKPFDGE